MVDINCITETDKAWFAELALNSQMIRFKVDTGAAVTAVPSSLSSCLGGLRHTDRRLRGAGSHALNVVGVAQVTLSSGDKSVVDEVYVVDGLVTPLLGKPAIAALGLVKFVSEVQDTGVWVRRFPGLFGGLGTFGTDVDIQLAQGHQPFVQSVPRRVAAARREPLRLELERMEKMGVIERIEEPTEWCSPCIVVPKPNGKIRVCIDFTRLNAAVRREFHPLPIVEETLGTLRNAAVFSKLDANSEYWQMRLRPEAQKLTELIMPFGRFVCKRLPFGNQFCP